MENATKALEMAASVLIGMLIIGALVFLYTKINQTKQTEQDALSTKQASDFNKKFEGYNKNGLYGSEILSLANLIEDYNKKEANEVKGYQPVELSVTIKGISGAQVFTTTTYNSSNFTSKYSELSEKITKANKTFKGKKVSYWANSSSELRYNFSDSTNPTLSKMQEYIKDYNTLVTEQEDVARKIFKCTKVEHNKNNGRITKMYYLEI